MLKAITQEKILNAINLIKAHNNLLLAMQESLEIIWYTCDSRDFIPTCNILANIVQPKNITGESLRL